MVTVTALEELRSFITANGEQCVMTPGTWIMLLWCADSWDVEQLLVHKPVLILAQVVVRSGWMMWYVQEMNHRSHGAHILLLEHITVNILKMQVSSAHKVYLFFFCCLDVFVCNIF